MKHFKLKNIMAALLICIMVFAMAGCNYMNRPDGAKNNSTDNNNRLAMLLEKDKEVFIPDNDDDDGNYTPPPTTDDDEDTPPPTTDDDDDDNGNDTPPPSTDDDDDEQDLSDTPFNAPGDVISKINEILGSISNEVVDATSSTGVKDELMTSRTVNIYLPYQLFDGQGAAVESIAGKFNMNINANIIRGIDYVTSIKRAVLSGDKADLMYVDQESWGYSQHFTQDISNFVNFDIADKLGTFSSSLSGKFQIYNAAYGNKYMVASGIASPYLLVYNPDNIVVPDITIPANDEEGAKEIKISDPVTMFNEKTWGVSAFTELLKASTVSGRVGLASIIDDDRNLDIWMGMENNASIAIEYNSMLAQVDSGFVGREALDSVGDNMDLLQSWYWSQISNDNSNYIAQWTDASDWENTVNKLIGTYSGYDPVNSYSFMQVDLDQYVEIKSKADAAGTELEFTAIPYGAYTESILLASANEDGIAYDSSGVELRPWSAGWIGGFSVLKNCENPSVALRVAEELTTAWKTYYEAPIVATMTEEQQARYNTMKENIGISFYRSVVKNVESVYSIYGAELSERLPKESRNLYASLQMFSDAPGSLTQPMYRKNTSLGSYDANTFDTWSDFYYGKVDDNDSTVTLSKSILTILSAAFVPPTMLFMY